MATALVWLSSSTCSSESYHSKGSSEASTAVTNAAAATTTVDNAAGCIVTGVKDGFEYGYSKAQQ